MSNKKKKTLIIMCIIVSISLMLLGALLLGNNDDVKKTKYNDLCRQIDNAKKNQKNFVVVINNHGLINDAIYELREQYNTLLVIEIDKQKLSSECFSESLKDTGEYERFLIDDSSVVIGYREGIYSGIIGGGQSGFEQIENYLNDLDIIEKPTIKNTLTYEEYKENTNLSEYFIIAITEEDLRQKISSNMKRIFPDTMFDIINIKSTEGEKIIADIKQLTKVNAYPSIFYFENREFIANGVAARDMHLEQFKQKLEKLD